MSGSARGTSSHSSRRRVGGGKRGQGGPGSSRMRVHWTRVTTVGSVAPAGREGHTASLSSTRVYTFGGLENGIRVSKLMSFDLERHRWIEHDGEGAVGGTLGDSGSSLVGSKSFAGSAGSKSAVGSLADDSTSSQRAGYVPPPRCYHGSWVVGHRLLYFGGEGATSNPAQSTTGSLLDSAQKDAGFKESQVFSDPATQRRTRRVCFDDVVLFNTINGSWETVKSGLAPLPRKGHSCTLVGSDNDAVVVVFGGEPSGKAAPMNDLHTVSVGSLLSGVAMWEKQRLLGDVPAPRHGHSAVALPGTPPPKSSQKKGSTPAAGDTLTMAAMANLDGETASHQSQVIVFGGTGGGGLLFNDVYAYGLTTKNWEAVLCDGNAPAPRYGHTAQLIPARRKSRHHHHHHHAEGEKSQPYRMGAASPIMVVFGGVTRTGSELTFCRDIHVLDLDTRTWSELRTTHLYPSARYGHAMVLLDNRFEPELDPAEIAYREAKESAGPGGEESEEATSLKLAAAAAAKRRAPYPKHNHVHIGTLLVFGGLNNHYCSSEIWAAEIQMMRRGRETWGDGFDNEMAALGAVVESPERSRRRRAPDVPAAQFEEVNRALMHERKAKIRAEEALIAERKLKQEALAEVRRLKAHIEEAEVTTAQVRKEAQAQIDRVRREGEEERAHLERLRTELDESRHLLSMMDLQGSLRVRAWKEKAEAAEQELIRRGGL